MTAARVLTSIAVALVFVGGCDTSPSLGPSLQPTHATLQALEPTPLPSISQSVLDAARKFRQDFGLRSDDAWIVAVLSNPTSDRDQYGQALTPEELEQLNQRTADIEAIRDAVISYGVSHPDDWAGAFIDQQRGGILVAQFSKNLEVHRRALFSRVRPGAPLEVNGVLWSTRELEALADRFAPQDPWFASIPAVLYGSGPDVATNRFELEVSTADPRAEGLILNHFKLSPDILQVTIDGTGALLLERGSLLVTAVDTNGHGLEGLACAAYADLPGAYDSHPLPMPRTNQAGVCVLSLPATGYWVRLEEGSGPPTVIAIGRAVVIAHETARITIEVK